VAHTNLGLALYDQGKVDEALVEFRKAIRLEPVDSQAHYHLGDALTKQRKRAETIAEFRMARDLASPGSALARLIERAPAASSR
jgi:cytochrome c-type biogenesis protein CcmH/NrfG